MSSQTDNLHLYKVDSSDKITDTWNNYNTNMDLIDGKLATVYKYKGAVAGTSNLPGNAEVGDVYDVTSTGMNYAWNGTQWDALGSVFTLPTASTSTLGGVKIDGSSITISNGIISAQTGASDYNDLSNKPITNIETVTLTTGSFPLDQGLYNIQKLILNGSENTIYANSLIYVDKTSSTSGAYYYINRIAGGGKYMNDNTHYYIRYTTSNGAYVSSSATYTLPTASTTTLGGVKVDGTTITADSNGVISSVGGGGGVQSDDVTNIVVSSTDIGTGATLTNGTLYLVYEE